MNTVFVDLEQDYEDDQSIYSDAAREFLLEEDEISGEEDGFMQGWDSAFDSNL